MPACALQQPARGKEVLVVSTPVRTIAARSSVRTHARQLLIGYQGPGSGPWKGADHSRVTFGGGDSLAASRRIPRYCSISWLLCYLARMAIRPPRSKMGCNRTIITCGAAKSMAAPRGTGLLRPLNFPRSHSAPLPLTPIAHRT